MWPVDFVETVPVEHDEPDTVGDGGMIGRLLIAIALVFGCLALVHVVARFA